MNVGGWNTLNVCRRINKNAFGWNSGKVFVSLLGRFTDGVVTVVVILYRFVEGLL